LGCLLCEYVNIDKSGKLDTTAAMRKYFVLEIKNMAISKTVAMIKDIMSKGYSC
jgi:hypothetical protein